MEVGLPETSEKLDRPFHLEHAFLSEGEHAAASLVPLGGGQNAGGAVVGREAPSGGLGGGILDDCTKSVASASNVWSETGGQIRVRWVWWVGRVRC